MFMAPIESDIQGALTTDALLVPNIWPVVAHAMMAEIHDGATPEQARGLFHALGKRIAAMVPVQDVDSVDDLCDRINGLWSQLGCGRVSMTLDDQGIGLRHDDPPHMPSTVGQSAWSLAIGPVLEGAYDAWFQAMGSHATLRTRVVSRTDRTIELRHAV